MKKLLVLVMVAVMTISLVIGCVGEVETYSDSGRTINIGVNLEFIIALGSNPTTGYSWQESHDESMLKLEESWYEVGEEAEEGVVGAGGVEYFRFKALKTGESEITMSYKRPWEGESIDQKVFTVDIK